MSVGVKEPDRTARADLGIQIPNTLNTGRKGEMTENETSENTNGACQMLAKADAMDAARYRWLCSMAWGVPREAGWHELTFRSFGVKRWIGTTKDVADASIDAAIGMARTQDVCRFPDCKCPMDPGPAPDWCARGLPHVHKQSAAGVDTSRGGEQ